MNATWTRAGHVLTVGTIYLGVTYAILATKLFPSHDALNNYFQFNYGLINSLLAGEVMLWNPAAACGSPAFLLFLTMGVLDPAFVASVAAAKILSLGVLQTYMLWILLRNLPVLGGLYWLMTQHCRNRLSVVLSTVFLFVSFSACLMADHIVFAVYWPLMLA